MAATATEQSILKVVAEAGRATKSQICDQTGLSPDYAGYLCKYLVRSGHLKSLDQGRYTLAPEGKKILVSLGWGVGLDEASIKELASQVAKEVSKTIKLKGVTREIIKERVTSREPEEGRRKIEIGTDYMLPVEDETVGLESNIGKIGAKTEKEGAEAVDASVRLLRSLKKVKSKK